MRLQINLIKFKNFYISGDLYIYDTDIWLHFNFNKPKQKNKLRFTKEHILRYIKLSSIKVEAEGNYQSSTQNSLLYYYPNFHIRLDEEFEVSHKYFLALSIPINIKYKIIKSNEKKYKKKIYIEKNPYKEISRYHGRKK